VPPADHAEGALAGEVGALATELGIGLSDHGAQRLADYARLVLKWQKITNLTGARDAARFVHEHVADSLALVPHLQHGRVLDVGSGAGLPGIVLAIACPELQVTLLEPRAKRSRFLMQACIELGLASVEVMSARLESYQPSLNHNTLITRAFGSLAQFLSASAHLHAPGVQLMAMKGAINRDELSAAQALAGPSVIVPLQVPGFDHRNLVIFTIEQLPDGAALSGPVMR